MGVALQPSRLDSDIRIIVTIATERRASPGRTYVVHQSAQHSFPEPSRGLSLYVCRMIRMLLRGTLEDMAAEC